MCSKHNSRKPFQFLKSINQFSQCDIFPAVFRNWKVKNTKLSSLQKWEIIHYLKRTCSRGLLSWGQVASTTRASLKHALTCLWTLALPDTELTWADGRAAVKTAWPVLTCGDGNNRHSSSSLPAEEARGGQWSFLWLCSWADTKPTIFQATINSISLKKKMIVKTNTG